VDLLHLVRSRFVVTLIQDSFGPERVCFRWCAAHSVFRQHAGHPTIHPVVAIEIPKLKKKYGDRVTYADTPRAHPHQFGFDMVQVQRTATPATLTRFIGFEVSSHPGAAFY